MAARHRFLLIIILLSFFFPLAVSHGEERQTKEPRNVVLTPADQMILDAIDRVAKDLNDRIDKVNDRIDRVAKDLNERIDNL